MATTDERWDIYTNYDEALDHIKTQLDNTIREAKNAYMNGLVQVGTVYDASDWELLGILRDARNVLENEQMECRKIGREMARERDAQSAE